MRLSLSNHKVIFEVGFSPALADLSEEEDVKPISPRTTPSRPTQAPTSLAPKQSEASTGSRSLPRPQTPVPSRRQRVTPARAIPSRTGASPTPSRQQNIKPVEILGLDYAPTPPRSGFADAAMSADIPERLPTLHVPPRTTINPSLLLHTPMIHLPMHYEPSFASLLETKDPVHEPVPSELTTEPLLPPLVSEYSASFYPLPPEKSFRKRKGGSKRTTVSGTPVVDLDLWEATMNVNPAARLARRSAKCISTREWEASMPIVIKTSVFTLFALDNVP